MSVINKMLRDLDHRQASDAPGGAPQVAASIAAGTRSVDIFASSLAPGRSADGRRLGWLALMSILVLTALVFGWLQKAGPVPVVQMPVAPVVAHSVDVIPIVAPIRSPEIGIEPAAQSAVPAASSVKRVAHAQEPVSRSLAAALPAASMPAGLKLKMQASMAHPSFVPMAALPQAKKTPVKTSVTAPAVAVALPAVIPVMTSPATAPAVPKPVRRAALEVLAQAQMLWQEGAQAGAVDLLRDALLRLNASTGAAAMDSSTIAAMAREYARMTMTQNQVGDALSMLTRLEPQLAGVADIWALRGSAAQRLGLHQQAAQAYNQALLLRPEEPRWMLAAAVSLAAQGKTGLAAELAEKARKAGGLPPDVANYLHQLGVAIQAD